MLDQNTDRMWFVIGAVIVGAAIIFIANGTMPELFASVTDTFSGAADEAMYGVNLLKGENFIFDGERMRVNDGRLDRGSWYDIHTTNMESVIGREMRVTFTIRNPEGTGGNVQALFADGRGIGIEHLGTRTWQMTDEWQTFTATMQFTADDFDRLLNTGDQVGHLSISSNSWRSGNNGTTYPHEVKDVRFDLAY